MDEGKQRRSDVDVIDSFHRQIYNMGWREVPGRLYEQYPQTLSMFDRLFKMLEDTDKSLRLDGAKARVDKAKNYYPENLRDVGICFEAALGFLHNIILDMY